MADQAYSDHSSLGDPAGGAQPLKGIVTPHENDVLSGRGNFVNYHSGNEHFRSLVKKHKIAYVACPKPEKGKFSRLIVDEIRSMNPPGRFLKQDPTTKLWYDIGDKKALDKTRQALREGAPELIRELHGEPDDGCGVIPGTGYGHLGAVAQDPYSAAMQAQMGMAGMGGLSPHQAAHMQQLMAARAGIMTKQGMMYPVGGGADGVGVDPGGMGVHPEFAARAGGDGRADGGFGPQGCGAAASMPSPQVQMQLAAAAQRIAAAQGLPPSAAASIINQIPLEALEPTPINPNRGSYMAPGGMEAAAAAPGGGGAAGQQAHVRPSSMGPPPNVAQTGGITLASALGSMAAGGAALRAGAGGPSAGQAAMAAARMNGAGGMGDAFADRPRVAAGAGGGGGGADRAEPVKVSSSSSSSGSDADVEEAPVRPSFASAHKKTLPPVSETEETKDGDRKPEAEEAGDKNGAAAAAGRKGRPAMERRDSLTLEDVKKASVSLRNMKNMAMSSTQMSFSVGDLDSNLSAAFEDSLVISPNAGDQAKKDAAKARDEAKMAVASSAAAGGGGGSGGGGGGRGVQAQQRGRGMGAAAGVPRGYTQASAAGAAGGEGGAGDGSSSIAAQRQMVQSTADMSFNFSDATEMLGASAAMGMSYRWTEEEEGK